MAAISFVFTIARVAEMLDEDEAWLQEISIEMFAEDGCLWVHDINDRDVVAFAEDGIDCLKQIIADQRDLAAESKSD